MVGCKKLYPVGLVAHCPVCETHMQPLCAHTTAAHHHISSTTEDPLGALPFDLLGVDAAPTIDRWAEKEQAEPSAYRHRGLLSDVAPPVSGPLFVSALGICL